MSNVDDAEARTRLAALALFSESAVRSARITRLFGLTNAVFRVDIAGERLCLRIPGAHTARLIERQCEKVNARAASRGGVAPEVVHFAPDGVMLTRFIEGAPLSPDRFRADPSTIDRAAHSLRMLHQEVEDFAGVFDVFERIAFYRSALAKGGVALSPEQNRVVDRTEAIKQALAAHSAPLKPCHCDPTGRNLIDTGEQVWLIDWEYSGMNDPAWDLAYLSVEGEFDARQDKALLSSYFGRRAHKHEMARLILYQALCQVLSALWAPVQEMEGNSAVDFWSYAGTTFSRAHDRMAAPHFAEALSTLRTRDNAAAP